jgi:hypothetical protein
MNRYCQNGAKTQNITTRYIENGREKNTKDEKRTEYAPGVAREKQIKDIPPVVSAEPREERRNGNTMRLNGLKDTK